MTSLADRLSRVAALRPVRTPEVKPDVSANAEPLVQQLHAEIVPNRLGSHLRLQIRFPQPKAKEFCFSALRLIAPEAGASVCDPATWLFLDTETTGLAGGTGTYAFLIGLAWWEEDAFVVEQHFMRDYSEEPALLLEIADRLVRERVLVTFNGKSFDWPLLKTRFRMSRMRDIPEPSTHLDLLYPARQLWRVSLGSVALTQLERHVLGFDRGPDIPSATIPQRYFDFLRGGPSEPIAEIFRHNQMDLCGLAWLALRMNEILEDPERDGPGAGELFGVSRMLQKRGEHLVAGRIYRKALDRGLPKEAEQVAQRELAYLAKRNRDYALSNELWEKLLSDTPVGFKAYEQLAMFYEHRADLPEKAAELSREALIRLQGAHQAGRISSAAFRQLHSRFHHRLSRLTKVKT